MSANSAKILNQLMPANRMHDIDHWISKYPKDQKQSAVMSALRIVQEEHGHLTTELMNAVAEYLDMPPIAVYEVASFYTMYEHKPVGRHLINVCTNISCMLRDSAGVVEHLEKKLGVNLGGTTEDGRFTLRSVECLGACVNAPMMQVDKDYHENLTAESIDKVLEQYQ
ncbi:TPA: NADH-quinone oxidoreductase subunit NuoE [Legionella pneumophila]|uniref:NADH-quinone oxidoreductase subunit E n=1 Tax=Legionella pneumophila subsp. pneumophila TaxID=91891 RepID=A0AAV2V0W8_LEGPN|nr:NADH-quinone oxidoreductase subunit NuoE [Legionella pneumophila]MCK1848309.1 NADH-quinone oxidoreductase subunit NuoE [Legionella pneumophila]MCZ4805946.1 NADH-quinone oxidoreductase subunit NuoE [Legionella pneumophila]MDI9851642.1 NADH-quinone oxidoreductase subunit NuoE [Legionella pneumophila]MDW8854301.1 NADH-quinone oxidoreductase subunit NuoE [Legionella pneumophila]MDW8866490.1 NADH-quinone oxidoreductase subunit NuoE [Legionella pneumophila]